MESLSQALADELVYRTKRSGHVTSKMRFQSAQVIAYLTEQVCDRIRRDVDARLPIVNATGAEFTQAYTTQYGSKIVPTENAVPMTAEARAQMGLSSQKASRSDTRRFGISVPGLAAGGFASHVARFSGVFSRRPAM